MPARVLRGFLLIGPSFAEKRVWFSQEIPNFLQNMLLTLFYLERHVMESKNYFWELIFMLMPTRVSRRFLLIGPSFAEKRIWFSQELPNFLQKYVAYTILSRKTCNGEQKLFWELIFTLMPTRVSRRFLLIGPSFAEKRVWFSQELPNFLQKYVAYTILSRKTCDGDQKSCLRINLHINAHKGIETIFADWAVFCWKTCMI